MSPPMLSAAAQEPVVPRGRQSDKEIIHEANREMRRAQFGRRSFWGIKKVRIGYEQEIKFATLNCRGLKEIVKRQVIERWMGKERVDILMLQETHMGENQVEERKSLHGITARKQRRKRNTQG